MRAVAFSDPLLTRFFREQFVCVKCELYEDRELARKFFPEYDDLVRTGQVEADRPMQWIDPQDETVLLSRMGRGGSLELAGYCREVLDRYPKFDKRGPGLEEAFRRFFRTSHGPVNGIEYGILLCAALDFQGAYSVLSDFPELSTADRLREARARFALGIACDRLRLWEESREQFERVLVLDPSDELGAREEIEFLDAYRKLTARQWESARDDFERLLERYPESARTADIVFHLGRAYARTGQKHKASALYERVLAGGALGERGKDAVGFHYWRIQDRREAPVDPWRYGGKIRREETAVKTPGAFLHPPSMYPGPIWDEEYPDVTEASGHELRKDLR